MKKISQILALILLISCTNSNTQDLESDPTINSVFSKNEIQDLKTILIFFNDQICSIAGNEKSNCLECYNNYCQYMYTTVNSDSGNFDIKIPYEEQQELYNKINDSTFNQIWVFSRCWNPNPPEIIKAGGAIMNPDTLKCIAMNRFEKYSEFIEKLGHEYELIGEYNENLQSAGDISPVCVSEIICEYKALDFNDERVQLFFAIHYLTLNDQRKRIEKY